MSRGIMSEGKRNMVLDSVAVLDCGGQYTKVIDRRIRELYVKSEIFPVGVKAEKLQGFKGIILSGGPASVWSHERPEYDENMFNLGIPVLGICYGFHLISDHFRGKVVAGKKEEYGETDISVEPACPLFAGLEKKQKVLMSHGDSVEALAEGFQVCAVSNGIIAAIFHPEKSIYGVQFHPEVDLTANGKLILENFIRKICSLEGNYILEDRIQTALRKIRDKAGDHNVIVLVSGGVDSTVSAALLLKALRPDQVYAIHIDHGFMRKNESREICENLKTLGLTHLLHRDESEFFYHGIVGEGGRTLGPIVEVTDPEIKRELIGSLFMRVVGRAAEKLKFDPDSTYIAQGTLRPDLIESGNPDVSSYARKIKTHHNDVELVRRARDRGMIIETNWDWHKDEVRAVAEKLGIDREIAGRQPFPGPGLAIRFICSKNAKEIAEEERSRFRSVLSNLGCSGEIVPIKTVGVQGDVRSYRYLALLFGEKMAADWKKVADLGKEIPGSLDFINRVG